MTSYLLSVFRESEKFTNPRLIASICQTQRTVYRLSMDDFKRGFAVQSLKSNFLRNNTPEALLFLLRIVGNIEYFLFVTFLNSMACYDAKVEQLRKEIGKMSFVHLKEGISN